MPFLPAPSSPSWRSLHYRFLMAGCRMEATGRETDIHTWEYLHLYFWGKESCPYMYEHLGVGIALYVFTNTTCSLCSECSGWKRGMDSKLYTLWIFTWSLEHSESLWGLPAIFFLLGKPRKYKVVGHFEMEGSDSPRNYRPLTCTHRLCLIHAVLAEHQTILATSACDELCLPSTKECFL